MIVYFHVGNCLFSSGLGARQFIVDVPTVAPSFSLSFLLFLVARSVVVSVVHIMLITPAIHVPALCRRKQPSKRGSFQVCKITELCCSLSTGPLLE